VDILMIWSPFIASAPTDSRHLPGSQIKGRMTTQEVVDRCQVLPEYLVT
jgi:hypothetical protein